MESECILNVIPVIPVPFKMIAEIIIQPYQPLYGNVWYAIVIMAAISLIGSLLYKEPSFGLFGYLVTYCKEIIKGGGVSD